MGGESLVQRRVVEPNGVAASHCTGLQADPERRTLSLTAPYESVWGPEELLATIPPSLHMSPLEGSGPNSRPSRPSCLFNSARTIPGCTRAQRSFSIQLQNPIQRETSRMMPDPIAEPVRFVPAARGVSGMPR